MSMFTKSLPVNKNATFNKVEIIKITLPLEPNVQIRSVVEVVEEAATRTVTENDEKLNLLHFIDRAKLRDERSSSVSKSYFLNDLKILAKKLDIFKNEKSKSFFIEQIKEEMDKQFRGENNLIDDIKKLNEDEIRNNKMIKDLFNKHQITEPTKTKLLNRIRTVIKNNQTSTVLTMLIIKTIESEWLNKK